MAYRVFVSHSFKDGRIVQELQKSLAIPGIRLVLAEADRSYGEMLPDVVGRAIDSSNCILVILTKDGGDSKSVREEIGYATRAHKLIVPMVEKGVDAGLFLGGIKYIEFTVDRLDEAISKAKEFLKEKLGKKSKTEILKTLFVVVGAILALVILWITLTRRKPKAK